MEISDLSNLELMGPGRQFQRILIYGVTGSGKTTLARWLSERTGIEWQEIDNLMWEPNWEFVPLEIQHQRIRDICAQDSWIMDAAYGKWLEIPLERVQLVIGLDYSRGRSFWQLLKRSIARAVDKKEVCNGNTESWRAMFSKDSILLWHAHSFSKKRERIRCWASKAEFQVLKFQSPEELSRWQREIFCDRSKPG